MTPTVVVSVDMGGGKSACGVAEEKAPTLACTHGGEPAVAYSEPAVTLKIRGGVEKDSHGKSAGKGPLIQTEKSATLGTSQDQTLFQPVALGHDKRCGAFIPGVCDPLTATDYKDPPLVAYGLDRASFNQGANAKFDFTVLPEQQPTLTARGPGAVPTHYIVRRLTPTECARLQGFPDFWGEIPTKTDMTAEEVDFWNDVYVTHQKVINGKDVKPLPKERVLRWYNGLHTDSAEYKMWGNGVALPCVRVPIHNMAKFGAKTLASLFDGSGGFPLAGSLEGITPVWCSEIEPYPIAVTRERFPELTDEEIDKILEDL